MPHIHHIEEMEYQNGFADIQAAIARQESEGIWDDYELEPEEGAWLFIGPVAATSTGYDFVGPQADLSADIPF